MKNNIFCDKNHTCFCNKFQIWTKTFVFKHLSIYIHHTNKINVKKIFLSLKFRIYIKYIEKYRMDERQKIFNFKEIHVSPKRTQTIPNSAQLPAVHKSLPKPPKHQSQPRWIPVEWPSSRAGPFAADWKPPFCRAGAWEPMLLHWSPRRRKGWTRWCRGLWPGKMCL